MNAAMRTKCSWAMRVLLCGLVLLAALVLFPAAGHAGTWTPFGPKTYTRAAGAPVTVTDTFTVLNQRKREKQHSTQGAHRVTASYFPLCPRATTRLSCCLRIVSK